MRHLNRIKLTRLFAIIVTSLVGSAGCHRDMRDQPRYDPLEASTFFADGQSARPIIAGTISRGSIADNELLATGKDHGRFILTIPVTVDRALLERGNDRFNIFCSPCHARTGNGDGMIVARGFQHPPSFHTDRLRNAPAGHVFDVMSQGFGGMPRFAPQITPRDRWAIVAYIRVLQLSQHVAIDELPVSDRAQLDKERP